MGVLRQALLRSWLLRACRSEGSVGGRFNCGSRSCNRDADESEARASLLVVVPVQRFAVLRGATWWGVLHNVGWKQTLRFATLAEALAMAPSCLSLRAP